MSQIGFSVRNNVKQVGAAGIEITDSEEVSEAFLSTKMCAQPFINSTGLLRRRLVFLNSYNLKGKGTCRLCGTDNSDRKVRTLETTGSNVTASPPLVVVLTPYKTDIEREMESKLSFYVSSEIACLSGETDFAVDVVMRQVNRTTAVTTATVCSGSVPATYFDY